MDIIPEYKRTLKGEVRVATSRRMNMRQLLVNYRAEAKDPKATTAGTCTCKEIQTLLHLSDHDVATHCVNGHLAIRATDLPADKVDPLLMGNLNNIPNPDITSFRDELIHSAEEWTRKHVAIAQSSQQKVSPIEFHKNMVHILDPETSDPKPMAKITLKRLQRWHAEYTKVRTTDPE